MSSKNNSYRTAKKLRHKAVTSIARNSTGPSTAMGSPVLKILFNLDTVYAVLILTPVVS
jgi:hypothetical protein